VDRLTQRFETARQALSTLDELVAKPDRSKVERDAAIQRFEYCFEAVWRTAQLYLREEEGLDLGSPKAVARASLQAGLLNDEETRRALAMADDRNLTVHTYNEVLANDIASRLEQHATLLHDWLDRMATHRNDSGTI
jgi:nucleotidyltransferase substrate binding protein (TIGR01987 family)